MGRVSPDCMPLYAPFLWSCSNLVLDRLGDTTSAAERDAYFLKVDTDGSNGVDFEEFLELVYVFESCLLAFATAADPLCE